MKTEEAEGEKARERKQHFVVLDFEFEQQAYLNVQ